MLEKTGQQLKGGDDVIIGGASEGTVRHSVQEQRRKAKANGHIEDGLAAEDNPGKLGDRYAQHRNIKANGRIKNLQKAETKEIEKKKRDREKNERERESIQPAQKKGQQFLRVGDVTDERLTFGLDSTG